MSLALLASLLLNLSLTLVLWTWFKLMKSTLRENGREKSLLLQVNQDLTDRIMHTQGVTWTPPPRPVPEDVGTHPEDLEWSAI